MLLDDWKSKNPDRLKSLLEFLNDYESQILQTLTVSYATGAKYNLHIQQIQARKLEFSMNGMTICIDEDSLKTMCRMRSYIQSIISSIEMIGKKCETSFFDLMNHICYGKEVTETCDLIETEYTQQFFNQLINFHCTCLDASFIIEIAMHFEKWFIRCVPHFIDTIMLCESSRLQIFTSRGWPYERSYIDIEKLARNGFYYIGLSDNTQCAFCNLSLHRWQSEDNPVSDHYKYNPSCPFLMDHENSLNVSDLNKPSELTLMMSVLDKSSVPSFDEVDVKLEI